MTTFRPVPAIEPGDAVSVIAPSSPFDREAFERGLRRLAERYRPRVSDGIFSRERYLAGDDERRAEELNEALSNDESRAIFCARGGYGAMRLLPSLSLPRRPKILVGFSDITALHAALQRQGWRSLHGPVLTQLGRLDAGAAREMFACLESASHRPELTGVPVAAGVAVGPVLGGNLSVLTRLVGTPFLPSLDGAILFLEDVGEAPYRIDRMIQHLKLASLTDHLAGVALGAFTDCGGDERPNGGDVAIAEFGRLGIPCVAHLAVGHGRENAPLPLGARARIDGTRGTLCFLEGAIG